MRAKGVASFKDYIDEIGIGWCEGHENAAGIGIPVDKFDEFKAAIEDALQDVELRVDIEADIEIGPSQVTDNLIKQLGALNRISGSGFKPITVLIRSNDYSVGFMSNGKHLKITDNKSSMIFVKWNDGSYKDIPTDGEIIGVGTISTAYYGRTRYTQCVMNDYIVNTTK